jgi:hypothetical protein
MVCYLENFNDWPARNMLRKSESQVSQKKVHCILYTPLTKIFCLASAGAQRLRRFKNGVAVLPRCHDHGRIRPPSGWRVSLSGSGHRFARPTVCRRRNPRCKVPVSRSRRRIFRGIFLNKTLSYQCINNIFHLSIFLVFYLKISTCS